MYKYKEPLTPDQLLLLDKLSKKDFSEFNETDVREEYITKILDLLGYEKKTDYEVEREESSDLKWLHIAKAKLQRFDYKFNIRKKYFWLIEAKSGKNRYITRENEEQAYLYSLNPNINCRFFAVCNGWLFNLYDRNKLLNNDDSNIFSPILSIKNSEIKDRFNELYSYLGSSEIIFKIKEDILLREIKNTLSAEINPDRLKQFKYAVDDVINTSATQVLENIRANVKNDKNNEADRLEKILHAMSLESIIDYIFDNHMTVFSLLIGCKVIKAKLLEHITRFNFDNSHGYGKIEFFFDYVFLRPMRTVQIEYFWNIVGLIGFLETDQRFSGLMCKYLNNKIVISDLLDKYLFDMLNFFENRPDIRAYIIIYPMQYRIIKSMMYSFNNSVFNEIISREIDIHNYFRTEEELSKMYFSKGHALIILSRNIIRRCMYDFIIKALARPSNNYPQPSIPRPSSIGEVVNTEIIKRTISELDYVLDIIEEKIDVDKLREQSQADEQDEMFAFDRYYQNPWNSIFFSSFTTIFNMKFDHNFNENVISRAKYLVENRFLYVWQYVHMTLQPKDRSMDRIRENNELLDEFKIIIKEKSEHESIIANIKYNTWDKPDIIQWTPYR
jgi:hypothetical protein